MVSYGWKLCFENVEPPGLQNCVSLARIHKARLQPHHTGTIRLPQHHVGSKTQLCESFILLMLRR